VTKRVRSWLLANSLLASLLLHGALFGGALGYLKWREGEWDRAMQIDMSGRSLLQRPANLNGGSSAPQPPQPWILASGRRFAPPPKAEALTQTAQPEAVAGPPCPAPCPDNAGDWVPAAATSRLPAGFDAIFGEEDLPRELRQSGQGGWAETELYIDAGGVIRKAVILRSSHPSVAAMAVQRLLGNRVKPAYGANGEAVACILHQAFKFELQ
jgi:hypothetical protein